MIKTTAIPCVFRSHDFLVSIICFIFLSSLALTGIGCIHRNNQASRDDNESLAIKYDKAMKSLNDNNFVQAENYFNEIIKIDSNYKDVKKQLKVVRAKKSDEISKCINDAQIAIDNNNYHNAVKYLNESESKLKEYQIKDDKLKLPSEYADKFAALEMQHYYNKGFEEYKKGNFNDAVEYLLKTYAINPHYKETLFWLGLSFAKQNEYNKAIEYLLMIDSNNSHFSDAQSKIQQYKIFIKEQIDESIAQRDGIKSDFGKQLIRDLGSEWKYTELSDDMGRGLKTLAQITSSNGVSFSFPYEGYQHATLTIRKHPKYGHDIIFQIQEGQFICSLDCTVVVRFDDGLAMTFSADTPSDYDTTAIFISDYHRFIKNLKKAKKVRIEASFYQEGNRVFEFDLSGNSNN